MTDQDYKFKYIKYKQKYLDLQNKIGGNPAIIAARLAAEEKRIAEKKEQERIKKENDLIILKPVIDEYNSLYEKIKNSKCGFLDCRNINSNIKKMKKLYDKIRYINVDIGVSYDSYGVSLRSKLNEAEDKRSECKCMTIF